MPSKQYSEQFSARCSNTSGLDNSLAFMYGRLATYYENANLFFCKPFQAQLSFLSDQVRTIVASNSSLRRPVATGMTNAKMSSNVPRAQPAPQIDMYVMFISWAPQSQLACSKSLIQRSNMVDFDLVRCVYKVNRMHNFYHEFLL